MPRFHFHLRACRTLHPDPDGTDLPDVAAAHAHAAAVANELMRHSVGGMRNWSMCVDDAQGERQFDLFFADVDPSLAACSPELRLLIAETSRRYGALTDAFCTVRATLVESRILIARARSRPHLAVGRVA
jgi:hypothetical protein